MKKCPFCAEDIQDQDETTKCRYCGSSVIGSAVTPVLAPPRFAADPL